MNHDANKIKFPLKRNKIIELYMQTKLTAVYRAARRIKREFANFFIFRVYRVRLDTSDSSALSSGQSYNSF